MHGEALNERQPGSGSADFFDRAESILVNACQLIDGFQGHAELEGDWTEWDQQTRDKLGELLIEVSEQNDRALGREPESRDRNATE